MERLCFVLFYPRILFFLYLWRSEEHTSELQSQSNLVCRLLLEKKKNILYQFCLCVIRSALPGNGLRAVLLSSLIDSRRVRSIWHNSTASLVRRRARVPRAARRL